VARFESCCWLAGALVGLVFGCESTCPDLPAPGDRLRVEVVDHVESTGRACVPLDVGDTFTRTVWSVETPYDQSRYDETGECPEVTFAPEVPGFLSDGGLGWECRANVCVAEQTTASGSRALVGRLEMQWEARLPVRHETETGMLTVLWRAPSGRTCRSVFEVELTMERG
jgi:hypothetical protein